MEEGTTRSTPTTGRPLLHGELTREIIGAFFEVYRILRPGYLESTYAGAMALELTERGIAFEREARLEVFYKGRVAGVYRPDIFVDIINSRGRDERAAKIRVDPR